MTLSIPETIRVLLPGAVVRKLPLEEYVCGVVSAALPSDAPLEALKAQAVAARTFGAITRRHIERGSDVCTLRHCQVWQESPTASARRAAEETRGIVAVHNGRLIDAYYFEHCDGSTRDATGILMQVPPYLRSVSCPCGFATLRGHGIGMCQRGAQVKARFGDSFDVILKHYFSGITLDREGGMPTPVSEPKTPPRPQVVTAPPVEPTPIPVHAPKAPRTQAKARKVTKSKAPRTKKSVRSSSATIEPIEAPPSTSTTEMSAPVESAQAKAISAPQPPESRRPIEAPKESQAPEMPSQTEPSARAEPSIPDLAVPALSQAEVAEEQAPESIEPAPPAPAEAVKRASSLESQPVAATFEPAPDFAAEEASWYPIAEEIVLGAGSFEAEMIDEALEASEALGSSAATIAPSDSGTGPIPADVNASPTAVSASSQTESPAPMPLEEPAIRPPLPETMPEEMPVFAVDSVRVEQQPRRPPPPLVEAGLLDSLRPTPPSQVLIDRLPGPCMIVGDLAKPGIIITIRDLDGHAVVTVSGVAPHYGRGGFEAPLAGGGTYAVTFDHHELEVNLDDETVFIQLSS